VIQYVALIANAVLALSWTIAWIPHLRVSVNRISEILAMKKEDEGADDEIVNTYSRECGVEVEVKNLSFTYPDSKNPTLKNVSMKIKKGESVSIIGGTGSGKSTLVRLLLNFYDADSGTVSINGTPYSELSKSEIRSAYSPELQRAMIFEGTLGDNILMGKREASEDELMRVISDCALTEFLNSHKEGLDYGLVGLGQNVSGGQKQRINMARTVIREAPVYIFDDSFSALDYLTERKIQKCLFSRLLGKTKIIVTQRVSTALATEHIFVMDKGCVVAEGTHTELIKSSDIYREICISQLGADAVEEVLCRG
jgi:ATP-binding cassette subfamily B protein